MNLFSAIQSLESLESLDNIIQTLTNGLLGRWCRKPAIAETTATKCEPGLRQSFVTKCSTPIALTMMIMMMAMMIMMMVMMTMIIVIIPMATEKMISMMMMKIKILLTFKLAR